MKRATTVIDTTEKIIAAAADLFAAHGYAAVSTKDIARRARVNEATLFRNVGDKRRLIALTIERHNQNTITPEQAEECMQHEDFREAMHCFCSKLVGSYTPTFIRLPLVLSMELSKRERDAWVKRYIVPRYKPVLKRITKEQRLGRLRRVPPAFAMTALIMALYGAGIAGEVFGDSYRKFFGISPINVCAHLDFWLVALRK